MASKMVSDSVKLGRRVAATTADRARNQRVVQGVITLCADVVPEGTTSLSLEEAQYYVGRQIGHGMSRLENVDDENLGRQVELGEERQARDQAYTQLYGLTLAGARIVEIAHGPEARKKLLGPDGEVPTDPVRLQQTAARCQRWLVEERFELGEGQLEFLQLDPQALAGKMEEPRARLEASLEALPEEEKHAVDSLAAKVRQKQALDQMIGRAARFLESLYDLAGLDFESDRIRPTSRQASRPASPPPQDTEPEENQPEETGPEETPAVTAGGSTDPG